MSHPNSLISLLIWYCLFQLAIPKQWGSEYEESRKIVDVKSTISMGYSQNKWLMSHLSSGMDKIWLYGSTNDGDYYVIVVSMVDVDMNTQWAKIISKELSTYGFMVTPDNQNLFVVPTSAVLEFFQFEASSGNYLFTLNANSVSFRSNDFMVIDSSGFMVYFTVDYTNGIWKTAVSSPDISCYHSTTGDAFLIAHPLSTTDIFLSL
jgi:hypothetical protein